MINKIFFSSKSDEWETPQWLFDQWDKEYHFTLDVCATRKNAKCRHYFTRKEDGLRRRWIGTCWCNPPYGRQMGLWIEKAYKSSLLGATVVCLVPSRTDTAWWHDWAMKGTITFLRRRLKFVGGNYSAPFPSAIIEFLPQEHPPYAQHLSEYERRIWGEDPLELFAPWLRIKRAA